MSDEKEQVGRPDGKVPVKISLNRPKKVLHTTAGTLYLRAIGGRELQALEGETAEIGRRVLAQCLGRSEDLQDKTGIGEDDVNLPSEEDLAAAGIALIEQNRWSWLAAPTTFEEIGAAALDAKKRWDDLANSAGEAMRRAIDDKYSYLGEGPMSRLQAGMGQLAELKKAQLAATSDRIQAAFGHTAAEALSEAMKGVSSGGVSDTLSKLMSANHPNQMADVLKGAGLGPTLEEHLRKTETMTARAMRDAQRLADIAKSFEFRPPMLSLPESHIVPAEVLRVARTPPFEDTKHGKTAISTLDEVRAQNTRLEHLTDVVVGLNETLIKDVLPAWKDELKNGQEAAVVETGRFNRSIWWAKWALFGGAFVSVLATAAATVWQVNVAREIDKGNTDQMNALQEVLKQQLEVQKTLQAMQERAEQADPARTAASGPAPAPMRK